MQTEPPKAEPPKRKRRWFSLTRDPLLIGLLAVEVFILLAGTFRWFGLDENRVRTALIAFGIVAVAMFLGLVRLVVVPLLRGRRWLQFSLSVLAVLAFAKWYQESDHSPSPLAITPTDIVALRSLQARVQSAAQKVLPAIVAVKGADQPDDAKPHLYQPYASGVIIAADGLVLSQFHVSHRYRFSGKPGELVRSRRPGDRTTVILSDGRAVDAELLGADQTYDLSLLRLLEPGPYPCVPIEPETAVQLGEWVLKLGHPLGYRRDRPSVVRLGRVLFQESETFVTDCNITGGDSGGPLIDLDGRFVGMIGDSGIPPKLNTTTLPLPEMLFTSTTSAVIRRCMPSMLRREMSPPDKAVFDKRRERFRNVTNTLPVAQWTQGATTALAFRGVFEPATSGVVEIRDASDQQVAVGTIVGADGFILTLASLLPAEPKCRLPDKQVVPAEVVGVNPAFDLALLKVSVPNLRPVEWASHRPGTMAGAILAAPSPSPTPTRPLLCVGVVSVPTRDLPGPFPKRFERPKIHAQVPGLLGMPTAEGYRLDTPDVVAANAGILAGDILVSIGDKPIRNDEDVWKSADGREAGEKVVVQVARDGKPLQFSIALDAEPLISSKPFADFPTLFEHDMPLQLNQCGGPVIDLDGKAVGITMYRGAYGCMAIPADCIEGLLPELRSGKFADIWDGPNHAHTTSKSQ